MNVSDRQHQQNLIEKKHLEEMGFSFEIDAYGYFVRFKGEGLGGAGVLDREKPLHWRIRDANLRDNLQSAIYTAQNSKFYKDHQQ